MSTTSPELTGLLEEVTDNRALDPVNSFHPVDDGFLNVDALFGSSGAQEFLLDNMATTLEEHLDTGWLGLVDSDREPVGLIPYASEIVRRTGMPGVMVDTDSSLRQDFLKVGGVH